MWIWIFMLIFRLQKRSSGTKLYIPCMLMCGVLRVCKCWGRFRSKHTLPAHFSASTCLDTKWLSVSYWLILCKKKATPFWSIPGQKLASLGTFTVRLKTAITILTFRNITVTVPHQTRTANCTEWYNRDFQFVRSDACVSQRIKLKILIK
jgi:hypothetical protein